MVKSVLASTLEAYSTRIQGLADDSRVAHQIVMLIDSKRAKDVLLDGLRVEQEMISSGRSRAMAISREGAVAGDL